MRMMEGEGSVPSIFIPVHNSQEEVVVFLDQLPDDPTDILEILKAEQAPLDLWLSIAREYFKQGKTREFLQILEEGSSSEIDEYYGDVKYERIAILNALAAYNTNCGKLETNKREKEEYFIRATHYYNKASKIDHHEPTTWVGKGHLLLAKGDLDQAYEVFKIALDGTPNNVPALLGQASVFFHKGKYFDSLKLYKSALEVNPSCPATVRLGIGLCHLMLKNKSKARQAFERVLQLDPENVEALVALGHLELNDDEAQNGMKPDAVREGMQKMMQAYEIYPFCTTALNYLGSHYFYAGQSYITEQLMEAALSSTDNSQMRAESFYNMARTFHAKGDYEKAASYYRASCQEVKNPKDFILPFYGLGQIHLKVGDFKAALTNFDKVLEARPDNPEALKVVGSIYMQTNREEMALVNFKKVTEIDPRDVDAWLEIGELLVKSDLAGALDALKRARMLMDKKKQPVPLELLNNIGVLHYELGAYDEAKEAYAEALGPGPWVALLGAKWPDAKHKGRQPALKIPVDSTVVPAEKLTTLFNLARMLERQHETLLAGDLYTLIVEQYPKYIDCYLRLASMAHNRRDYAAAMGFINDALKVDEDNIDVLSMKGLLEMKGDSWVKARETFKEVQQLTQQKDTYSMVALGNWNFFAATKDKRDTRNDATHLEKAKELYQRALVMKPSNLFAASGIGCLVAERGQFEVAKEIFTQVQEGAAGTNNAEVPHVWINLAHVYLGLGQFVLAIKMYQNCSKKFYNNTNAMVLLYLARAHYEAEQMEECKKVLRKAMHLAPTNYTLKFDAAVAMQKLAVSTLQKTKCSADEVRKTVAEIKNALALFQQLHVLDSQPARGFDSKKTESHIEYLKATLESAKGSLETVEREEQQLKQKVEKEKALAEVEKEKRRQEDKQRAEEERKRRLEREKRALEFDQKFEELRAQWKEKDKPAMPDDGNEDGNGGGKKKKDKKRKKKDEKRRTEEEEQQREEDEEQEWRGGDSPEQEREDGGGDERREAYGDDDMDEDVARGQATGSRKKRKKNRKVVGSDDEEEEEGQMEMEEEDDDERWGGAGAQSEEEGNENADQANHSDEAEGGEREADGEGEGGEEMGAEQEEVEEEEEEEQAEAQGEEEEEEEEGEGEEGEGEEEQHRGDAGMDDDEEDDVGVVRGRRLLKATGLSGSDSEDE